MGVHIIIDTPEKQIQAEKRLIFLFLLSETCASSYEGHIGRRCGQSRPARCTGLDIYCPFRAEVPTPHTPTG
ncbi:MAG: hypothetical protein D3914_09570 [Candidatus Electrothrix sp. LOE2]|nr:hypothetical protein [Candidatus Electrothrix sp. LOE2]